MKHTPGPQGKSDVPDKYRMTITKAQYKEMEKDLIEYLTLASIVRSLMEECIVK